VADHPPETTDSPLEVTDPPPRNPPPRDPPPRSRKDRLLPWIAAERGVRAVFLVVLGVVLVTHPHTDWAAEIKHLAHQWGLDPSRNVVHKIINAVRKVHAGQNVVFGTIALGYAVLEGAEAYGLARRRRWGEWLTLLATSILLIPEMWELIRKVTPLKVAALVVNLLVVAYLYWRLRRRDSTRASAPRGDAARPFSSLRARVRAAARR
jgi:uncharacterized membrane protein (DUF2068 family)